MANGSLSHDVAKSDDDRGLAWARRLGKKLTELTMAMFDLATGTAWAQRIAWQSDQIWAAVACMRDMAAFSDMADISGLIQYDGAISQPVVKS